MQKGKQIKDFDNKVQQVAAKYEQTSRLQMIETELNYTKDIITQNINKV